MDWRPLGGALTPPPGSEEFDFWAPEVIEHQGTFYLYYSRGGGAIGTTVGHQLHVATSARPEGPYTEIAALPVANSQFTIDAHALQDTDGQWYLFYARDFIDTTAGYYSGTGLVVDKLLSMTQLASHARCCAPAISGRSSRPTSPCRSTATAPLPSGTRWRGRRTRRHDGKYYCFFSGANFLTDRYGVDYCVAEHVLGPYAASGSDAGARVLHSVPGHVRGPGYHSHVMSPDSRTEYLMYHAWNTTMTARELCINKLA